MIGSAAADLNVGSPAIRRGVLYRTDDHPDYAELRGSGGLVATLPIDPHSGRLQELSRQPTSSAMATYAAEYIAAIGHGTRSYHDLGARRGRKSSSAGTV